jgi:hypothetical protein
VESEADTVPLTKELKYCLRLASALVEMSDIWLKQQKNKATPEEMKRACFLTKTPWHYDYFKMDGLLRSIAVKPMLRRRYADY